MIDRARIEQLLADASALQRGDADFHPTGSNRDTPAQVSAKFTILWRLHGAAKPHVLVPLLTDHLALLTIVEALAANQNIPYEDEQGPFCVCCERSWPIGSVVSISDHEATCAYRQAVELLGREDR